MCWILKAAVEKQLRDAADVMDRYKKLQTDFNNQELVVNTLMAENQSRNAELKASDRNYPNIHSIYSAFLPFLAIYHDLPNSSSKSISAPILHKIGRPTHELQS